MKCPYCNNQMEIGRIQSPHISSLALMNKHLIEDEGSNNPTRRKGSTYNEET